MLVDIVVCANNNCSRAFGGGGYCALVRYFNDAVIVAKIANNCLRIFGHALKNSLIPVITYFGPMLAYIVTGSLVVEQIFAVPGIGRAFVNSITNRDYPLIMGTTIVLATLIVVMNLISDILYKVADPRINLE